MVSVAQPLDHETDQSYALTMQAHDGGLPPLLATTTVLITVEDVNDAPVFKQSSYTVTVPEYSPIGSTVATVSATDADINDKIVYSIAGGNENPSASIRQVVQFLLLNLWIMRESQTTL